MQTDAWPLRARTQGGQVVSGRTGHARGPRPRNTQPPEGLHAQIRTRHVAVSRPVGLPGLHLLHRLQRFQRFAESGKIGRHVAKQPGTCRMATASFDDMMMIIFITTRLSLQLCLYLLVREGRPISEIIFRSTTQNYTLFYPIHL